PGHGAVISLIPHQRDLSGRHQEPAVFLPALLHPPLGTAWFGLASWGLRDHGLLDVRGLRSRALDAALPTSLKWAKLCRRSAGRLVLGELEHGRYSGSL